MALTFYDTDRSSAAYRVRIALALKAIAPRRVTVDIHAAAPANRQADYLALNPQGLVPALVTEHGWVLTQSLAIIDYLDTVAPEPPLLPEDAEDRAFARSVFLAVASDIHPFGTPRVGAYLAEAFAATPEAVAGFTRHWVEEGLAAVEALLARRKGAGFAVGERAGLAEIAIVPQLAVARRLGIDVEHLPRLREIEALSLAIPAFADTAPGRRAEAEAGA